MAQFDPTSTYIKYDYKYSNGDNLIGCTQHAGRPLQEITEELCKDHEFWYKALKPRKGKLLPLIEGCILKVLTKEEVEQQLAD